MRFQAIFFPFKEQSCYTALLKNGVEKQSLFWKSDGHDTSKSNMFFKHLIAFRVGVVFFRNLCILRTAKGLLCDEVSGSF